MNYLRTSDLAKAVGIHANTVRRYADKGLLPPVEHSPSGYRRFTQHHLDCLRHALDTPRPDEDVYLASDRWISTLTDQGQRAHTIIALIEEMIQKQTIGNC